jgi:drug/metabolite transporter (DMT)-like permease
MPTTALALVLLSALAHASWNAVFKKSGGGHAFLLGYSALIVVLLAPVALTLWVQLPPEQQTLSTVQWLFIVGSGVIHFAYFVVLDKAYRVGDLSVVYPVARSTGPLLTIAGAVLLFGERPTALALAGAALIGTGAVLLATGAGQRSGVGRIAAKPVGVSIGFALATGLFIALYTVWDRYAVRELAINIWVFDWLSSTVRFICMLALFWPIRRDALQAVRLQIRPMMFIAMVSPLSYILFLYAATMAPLAYIAPAREISVVFGALLGTLLLREGQVRKRVLCSGVMLCGLWLIAAHA